MSTRNKLIIIGIGTNAEHIFQFVQDYHLYDVVGFAVNDEYRTIQVFHSLPVYSIEELDSIFNMQHIYVFVALLWNRLNAERRKLYYELKKKNFKFAKIISPKAIIHKDVSIGDNCWIHDYVVIQNNATIGNNVAIMAFSLVGAHSIIGNHCFLGAKCTIAGQCAIGDQSFIGINCTVFDGTTVGKKCILGACTTIKRNVPNFSICKSCSDIVVEQYTDQSIEEKLIYTKNIR